MLNTDAGLKSGECSSFLLRRSTCLSMLVLNETHHIIICHLAGGERISDGTRVVHQSAAKVCGSSNPIAHSHTPIQNTINAINSTMPASHSYYGILQLRTLGTVCL